MEQRSVLMKQIVIIIFAVLLSLSNLISLAVIIHDKLVYKPHVSKIAAWVFAITTGIVILLILIGIAADVGILHTDAA